PIPMRGNMTYRAPGRRLGVCRARHGTGGIMLTSRTGRRPAMTGGPADNEPGVTTKISSLPFAATVSRLTSLLDAKGMTTFAVIDQRAAALGVGVDLRDTTLVLFGSPAAGTPVMAAAPLAALDLPLKVLIWAEE